MQDAKKNIKASRRDSELDRLLRKPIERKKDDKKQPVNVRHVRGWSVGDRSNFTDSQIELMED